MSNVTARPTMTPTPGSMPVTRTDAPRANGEGGKGAKKKPSELLPGQTLVRWLRDMYLIREFENRTAQAYQQAKIGGFCHLYIGQEATAVGTINAVNQDDPIVTAYRDHGHAPGAGDGPGRVHGGDVWKEHRLRQGQGGVDAHV